MPDQGPSFEQVLETDLRQLAAEIQKNREQPEFRNSGEKAIVKESLRVFAQTQPPSENGTPAVTPSRGPLPAYADASSPEVKLEIEYLLDVALKHGINKAFTESQKSPYFVQDAFHDALAGRLYPELQRRGMVK